MIPVVHLKLVRGFRGDYYIFDGELEDLKVLEDCCSNCGVKF